MHNLAICKCLRDQRPLPIMPLRQPLLVRRIHFTTFGENGIVDKGFRHRPPGQGLAQVRDDPWQAHSGARPAVGQASGADENFHGLSRHSDGVDSFLHDSQLLYKIKNAGRQNAPASCCPARVD